MIAWVALAGVLFGVVTGLSGYLRGYSAGEDHIRAQQRAQEDIIREAIDASSQAAASAIAQIKVRHVTVNQKLEREIVEKQVFRDCRSGPDAVRLWNSTLPGAAEAPAQPASSGVLPAPATSH